MTTLPWQRYAAELLGTFLLTFAVLTSLSLDFPVPTVLVAAVTLGVVVYSVGSVSGAHVNPAITIGLFGLRKITFRDALGYVIAQLLGAFLATMLLKKIVDPDLIQAVDTSAAIIGELLGSFVFGFGVAAVAHDRVHEAASGLAVGSALFLGIVVASSGSHGVINPAVAIGVGAISPVYLIAPVIGAALGMQLYRWIISKKK